METSSLHIISSLVNFSSSPLFNVDRALKAAERARVLSFIPEHQPDCIMLNTLPIEVLFIITAHIKDAATLIKLSATCQSFKALIEEHYENQYRQLVDELILFAANCVDKSATRVRVPTPYSQEWKKLKYQALETTLPIEEQIKKIYIMGWDLLLAAVTRHHKKDAAKLMKVVLEIVPYIDNKIPYVKKLFPSDFPATFFHYLAHHTNLDHSLQLIIRHFPIEKNSPASQFILKQCPPQSLIEADILSIEKQRNASFLFYAVGKFLSQLELNIEHKIKGSEALIHALLKSSNLEDRNQDGDTILLYILLVTKNIYIEATQRVSTLINWLLEYGADPNARDAQGLNALDKVLCENNAHKMLRTIQALLNHPKLEKEFNNKVEYALYKAIEANDLEQVESLLRANALNSNSSLYFFYYAIWRGQDPIIHAFLHYLSAQEKLSLINNALILAIESNDKDEFSLIVKRLITLGGDCNIHAEGVTVLRQACLYNQEELILFLLEQPTIEVNEIDEEEEEHLLDTLMRHKNKNLPLLQTLFTRTNNAIQLSAFNKAVRKTWHAVAEAFLQTMQQEEEKAAFVAQAFDLALTQGKIEVLRSLRGKYGTFTYKRKRDASQM
jgi:ankyrin repeat protein